MENSKFKIGDRVRVLSNEVAGETGEIIAIGNKIYEVAIPKCQCKLWIWEKDLVKLKDRKLTLGQRIDERRQSKGITRVEMASMIGVCPETFRLYERDKVSLSFDVAIQIAEVLDVSLNYLAGKEDLIDEI